MTNTFTYLTSRVIVNFRYTEFADRPEESVPVEPIGTGRGHVSSVCRVRVAGDGHEKESLGDVRERQDGHQGRLDKSDDRIENRPVVRRKTDVGVHRQMVRTAGATVLVPLSACRHRDLLSRVNR